ncbi:MAG: uracil-DNA glycosylase family protein [Flavobacteriales bacterium]|nr:uracil-DNA glycosylase family protein [Flavobacteriales bacterium]
MDNLLAAVRKCTACRDFLPNEPKPVIQAGSQSKILVIGQAPGQKVQDSGIPWDDASGNNLRAWLGVDRLTFYDETAFALVPMGFCYPGTGKSGDYPPRPECAPLWHQQILQAMPDIELTLLIGNYAQKYYLKNHIQKTLTDTVKNYRDYWPDYFPLPHPSPRNNIWQKKNSWFREEVIPMLQENVKLILADQK